MKYKQNSILYFLVTGIDVNRKTFRLSFEPTEKGLSDCKEYKNYSVDRWFVISKNNKKVRVKLNTFLGVKETKIKTKFSDL